MVSDKPYIPLIPPEWPIDVQCTDETGDVDLANVEYNLSLTVAERIRKNDQWAQFLELAREAGRKLGYGRHDAID